MGWKRTWLAVLVTMGSGLAALAQQPNPYGFPSFPMPPSAPYAPLPPVPPNTYYRPMPTPIPPDPRMPLGQRPPSAPVYVDGGPKPGAAEPYLVQPDVPSRQPVVEPTPPFNRFVEFVAPSGPTEPYTTYEGQRYAAEVRNDNTRTWAQVNFIHWWVRGDNTPPLVTTGDPLNPRAGVLGNPDTVILLGGSIGPSEFSGIQTTLGFWLDPERLESLEIGGFWLGRNSRQYRFASDEGGNPQLLQPVIVGGVERGFPISQPTFSAGTFSASSALNFHSLELNLARNLLRLNGWSVDYLFGVRYLYMNDTLNLDQSFTVLPAGAGNIPFNGVGQPAGANFVLSDSFNMTNRFYGGQIGARFNWTYCRFDLGAILKLGLGATAHTSVIDGTSTLNVNGASTTVSGGTLTQLSNIGRVTSTDFSVVPEVTATLGFQVNCNLRLLLGYTFLDWNRVQRAGNQIDREIDTTQAPIFGASGIAGTSPRFPGVRTDFWAQGVNVGLELKY